MRLAHAAYLRRLGGFVQQNSGRLLAGLTVSIIILCFAIKSAKFDLDLNNWLQKSSLIESELNFISHMNGDGAGSNSELIIQTPINMNNINNNNKNGVLNVEAMMIHLEAMAIASHISVDLFDVTWTLKDICFRPTLPNIEGFEVTNLLDKMMPCAIKTPLDCFWEGSKLHGTGLAATSGSDTPLSSSSLSSSSGPPQPFGLKQWTELDPINMIESLQKSRPHASIDYQSLLDWMLRVGIKHGYQRKPCLDPTDLNCPETAPNKFTKARPNIGQYLTGGCFGVAENQMHWREEEIVGGSIKNKTGFIVKASAIQSSIPLMCEQDLYDYWSKTKETIDINNWSIDKARMILDAWEQRFKDELDLFTRSLLPSQSSQKIHSINTKSMLEPIEANIVLDYTNLLLSFSLMTLFTCIVFPKFKFYNTNNNHEDEDLNEKKVLEQFNDEQITNRKQGVIITTIDTFNSIQLALASSIIVGLTFIASLGFCSFMNLPFNIATTQILPPIALYYGFNQMNSIINIYSSKFGKVPIEDLTINSLIEMFPIILIESKVYLIAFVVASSIIPIPATDTLVLQAITYIIFATIASLILLPAIISNFLVKEYRKQHISDDEDEELSSSNYESDSDSEYLESATSESDDEDIHQRHKRRVKCDKGKTGKISSIRKSLRRSPVLVGGFKSTTIKSAKQQQQQKQQANCDDSEDIFSRIQNDLKNIQVTSRNNTPTSLYSLDSTSKPINNPNAINETKSTKTNNTYHPFIHPSNQTPDYLTSTSSSVVQAMNIRQPHRQNFIDDFLRMNDCGASTVSECSTIDIKDFEQQFEDNEIDLNNNNKLKQLPSAKNNDSCDTMKKNEKEAIEDKDSSSYLDILITNLISNRYVKVLVIVLKVALLIQLIPYAQQVKFGIQLKDIVAKGTEQYDSYSAQEKYFSIYNIFTITKGNFDYPAKQKLLHDYYKSISNLDGIVKDKNVKRFWLVAFRDWLLDLQQKFDVDRKEEHISNEGWTEDASEASKLAYKLLAQTGRNDNPIDRLSIQTNRLVDSNGIINQKAFYHYLTAWVSCDSFVYATTEANFKPEPKLMKEDPNDLRIEKARPIQYAQIPFLMKPSLSSSANEDNTVKLISKIRNISKTYEQTMNLPNFPTGTPFIFWDQFLHLDSLILISISIALISIFIIINLWLSFDFNNAAIVVLPIVLTIIELYCFMGLFRIQFNNIMAVLIICSIGITIGQSVHYVTYFANIDGDSNSKRVHKTIRHRIIFVITNQTLLFLCIFVFLISRVDFMISYSYLLLAIFQSNLFNSLLLIPILLSTFGSSYGESRYLSNRNEHTKGGKGRKRKKVRSSSSGSIRRDDNKVKSSSSSATKMMMMKSRRNVDDQMEKSKSYLACSNRKNDKNLNGTRNSNSGGSTTNKTNKKRSKGSLNKQQIIDYQRKVQSEQSLSTISEEP